MITYKTRHGIRSNYTFKYWEGSTSFYKEKNQIRKYKAREDGHIVVLSYFKREQLQSEHVSLYQGVWDSKLPAFIFTVRWDYPLTLSLHRATKIQILLARMLRKQPSDLPNIKTPQPSQKNCCVFVILIKAALPQY